MKSVHQGLGDGEPGSGAEKTDDTTLSASELELEPSSFRAASSASSVRGADRSISPSDVALACNDHLLPCDDADDVSKRTLAGTVLLQVSKLRMAFRLISVAVSNDACVGVGRVSIFSFPFLDC